METRNYKWANKEHTLLNFEVKQEGFGWLPYTTHADMTDEIGKEIWEKRKKLNIAEYEEPEGYVESLARKARAKRDKLLAETDYLIMADYPISEEKRQLVKEYRQALRDITNQEGFPRVVSFPEKPSL